MTAVARGSGIRWPDVTAFVVVALTAAVGALAYPHLPAEVVVGWRVGLDGAVTRTVASRALAVGLIPAAAVGAYALARAVTVADPLADSFDDSGDRLVYDLVVNLVLAGLCVGQVAIVLANL